jgi:hypothetical protein
MHRLRSCASTPRAEKLSLLAIPDKRSTDICLVCKGRRVELFKVARVELVYPLNCLRNGVNHQVASDVSRGTAERTVETGRHDELSDCILSHWSDDVTHDGLQIQVETFFCRHHRRYSNISRGQ